MWNISCIPLRNNYDGHIERIIMNYRQLFAKENENVKERYDLTIERIQKIENENTLQPPYTDFFVRTAGFIIMIDEMYQAIEKGCLDTMDIEELRVMNEKLYSDIAGSNYEVSYANPAYASARLENSDFSGMLSFLYVEIRALIAYAFEGRLMHMTVLCELFLEVLCLFEGDKLPEYKEVHDAIYWYVSDYADIFVEHRIRELVDEEMSFARDIIMESDLDDLRYLYKFGEYITENELETARHINSLSDEDIKLMASTFTEGYRKGFELGNKDLSKKKTVNIRYILGFERLVREEIRQFEEMGLKSVIYRAALESVNKRMHIRNGYYGAVPNKQMEYDHRFDNTIYLDKAFVERKLAVTRVAYERYKDKAAVHGGPAVMEIFGETPFEPVNKKESLTLTDKQKELSVMMSSELAKITNEYIKGEERSFTIIAYPIPEIGRDFKEIFNETVKINTLDYEKYRDIQQTIIDAMDGCERVEIKGCNGNETDITVSIAKLNNPQKETAFENCVADVNIPLGEVFTSPVLSRTTGVLNVSSVYLNDIRFDNLKMRFVNGKITDYTCSNFEDEKECKALIKQTVLFDHETLPMGEFAIGTNTTAYVMANKYDIVYKLPILIVEKMGPHFAVGDTCYSWSEDTAVFNPDGKEIIARDNEVSILRKEDVSKAYMNCHTDITIPYDEIGSIEAVFEDGRRTKIIHKGRFVLKGTEELNKPFEK